MKKEGRIITEDFSLLTRNQFTSGQYHAIEVLAKTLDQTVPEYLRETLLEAVTGYAQTDMIDDILERELGLKEEDMKQEKIVSLSLSKEDIDKIMELNNSERVFEFIVNEENGNLDLFAESE